MADPSPPPLNPFPGLRPFEIHENHLFFGRDTQTDELLRRLRLNRFLAVIGTSGSGKSSLVRAGLLPDLYGGSMVKAGSSWRITIFRPGDEPVHNLAVALSGADALRAPERDATVQAGILEMTLRRSALGLVEAVREARMAQTENLLVVVDQFEELFRFKPAPSGVQAEDELAAFVKLLLNAARQDQLPIYVVITMRSDYLGDCAQFRHLPETINEGMYLVPRMTRDQRREAITGPVAVGGGQIAPRLVNRLLNDVTDDPDQLPILQHALMRTWDFWAAHHSDAEPIDLRHYEAIGGMTEALSRQADEAYNELPDARARLIAEKMFKRLTEKGTDNRETRRPSNVRDLCEVGGASEQELRPVIEVFRCSGRSFLTPSCATPLTAETIIDISHESLMRVWERLQDWAEDEADSARRYRRLAETAALEKTGKAGLWRDPDLQLALDWQEEQAPTPAWANLYGGEFESATAFLEKSRSERDHERAEVDFERRWSRIRLLIIFIMLPIAAIAGIFLWRLSQKWGLLNLWVQHKDILGLTCFFTPYFLGYFAFAYSGKWIFRRFAFAKILQEEALSSNKTVREHKLAKEALEAAVELQMTYASFWRRSGAYLLDYLIVAVIGGLLGGILGVMIGLLKGPEYLLNLAGRYVFAWLYAAIMLSSRRQATLGKLALGIFVTDQKGDRLHFGRATARHFAMVFSYLTLGIGFFIQPFTRKRQALHDLIARTVVLVRPDKKVQRWIVVLCVIIVLIWASLIGFGFIVGITAVERAQKQNDLGLLYQNGQGVPKDLVKAAELYQKAADQGNAAARNNLGLLYQNGQGVPKDLRKAAELYQKAANQGNAAAQNNLGWLYENGQGVPKDLKKAAELYQKAADQGNAAAQNNLGSLYENGQGVPKDSKKAAELYQKAADQGNAFAQNNLGLLYENGQGVPKDLGKAAELYQKAANQGDQAAIANLKRLSGH